MMRTVGFALLLAATPAVADKKPTGPVKVYVWDRGGLTGLYCSTKTGTLASGAGCSFSPRLTIPLGGKSIAVSRKRITREGLDGSKFELTTYRIAAGIRRPPLFVVESRQGLTVWTGELVAELGPNGERLPTAPPKRVHDKSGVPDAGAATVSPPPTSHKSPVSADITLTTEGKPRSWTEATYTQPVVFGTLDLDGDGKTELVLLGTDDGGSRVTVIELAADPDADADFHDSVGG